MNMSVCVCVLGYVCMYMIFQWCELPWSVGNSSPAPVPSPRPYWHSTPGRLSLGGTARDRVTHSVKRVLSCKVQSYT